MSANKERPSAATLRKYGMTRLDFQALLDSQNGVCAICHKVPSSGIWHIDHVHVRGWKDMPPEKRKTFVRGILCQFDNRFYMAQRMTIEKAKNIITYLEEFERRKP